jgi:hypothetical protein
MKQTIFGMILGVLSVLIVFVGVEIYERYATQTASGYVAPTEFTTDIDGIQYRSKNL